jgi:CBS-domain-containing membrane protein
LLNVVLQRRDPVSGATTVGEVMTPHPIVIYPEATVTEAARVMLAHKVKRLPVVDDVGRLVGVVSRADLMSAFTIPDEELADTVRQDVLKRVLLLDPGSLDVEVKDGVASISGEVPRRSDARILEELTRRLDGIVNVETDLTWELDDTRIERPPPNLP